MAHRLVALRHVESSQTRDQTHVSVLLGGFSTTEPPGKPLAFLFDLLVCWTFKHEIDKKRSCFFFFFLKYLACWVFVNGRRLRIAVLSLAVERGFQGMRASAAAARKAPRLWSIRLSGCGGWA